MTPGVPKENLVGDQQGLSEQGLTPSPITLPTSELQRLFARGVLLLAPVFAVGCNNNPNTTTPSAISAGVEAGIPPLIVTYTGGPAPMDGGASAAASPSAAPTVYIGSAWSSDELTVVGGPQHKESHYLTGVSDLPEAEKLDLTKMQNQYVHELTGEIDKVPYREMFRPPKFYQEKITPAAELLVKMHKTNKRMLTPNAQKFVEANLPLLEAIAAAKPKNHEEFLRAVKPFTKEQVLGPEGVLNLELAFNRLTSRLTSGSLNFLTDHNAPLEVVLNLKPLSERKSAITYGMYTPEIQDPHIAEVGFDISKLRVQKRMTPAGNYEVKYFGESSFYVGKSVVIAEEEKVILDIDTRSKTVKITTHFYHNGPAGTKTLTFAQFDDQAKKDPFFIHGI